MTKPYLVLFDKNTMLLKLLGLKDTSNGGGFINDAIVTAQIKDSADANVGSVINLSNVGPEGDYEGSAPHTLPLVIGGDYTAEITATKSGLQGLFKPKLVVQERTTD